MKSMHGVLEHFESSILVELEYCIDYYKLTSPVWWHCIVDYSLSKRLLIVMVSEYNPIASLIGSEETVWVGEVGTVREALGSHRTL